MFGSESGDQSLDARYWEVIEQYLRASTLPDGSGGRLVRALTDVGRLTGREREVFDCIGLGMTNRLIARTLGVSERTVKAHVGQIIIKLGTQSRSEVVVLSALRRYTRYQSTPSKVQ